MDLTGFTAKQIELIQKVQQAAEQGKKDGSLRIEPLQKKPKN